MDLVIKKESVAVAVTLNGRLDATGSNVLSDKLTEICALSSNVVLDLEKVDYISSVGIRVLLKMEKQLRAVGGGCILAGMTPNVIQALELSGLIGELRASQNAVSALKLINAEKCAETKKFKKAFEGREYSIQFADSAISNLEVWEGADLNANPEISANSFTSAAMSELGISFGFGGFGANSSIATENPGEFIALGSFSAISPALAGQLPDYITTLKPEDTFIYTLGAIGVSGDYSADVKMWYDSECSLAKLVSDMMEIKKELCPNSIGAFMFVIACETDNPEAVYFDSADCVISRKGVKSRTSAKSAIITGVARANSQTASQAAEFVFERILKLGGYFTADSLELHSHCIFLDNINSGILNAKPNELSAQLSSLENIIDCANASPNMPLKNARIYLYFPQDIFFGEEKRLKIEYADKGEYPAEFDIVIRKIYSDAAKVVLKPLHGGFSSKTFFVDSYDKSGRRQLPTVLKIASIAVTQREINAYRQSVEKYILNNSTTIMGSAQYSDWAGLRYNFVGITGSESKLCWLEKIYQSRSAEELIPLFDRIFTDILKPWYGQPRLAELLPYSEHHPAKIFKTIEKDAYDELGISSDEPEMECPLLGKKLTNPFYFLKHIFPKRANNRLLWYKSIVHGDLNMKNILLDEQENIYVIDFSETRESNILSDFARLEPILKFEMTTLNDEDELKRLLEFETALAEPEKLGELPNYIYSGADPAVEKAYKIICRLREYADKTTIFETNIEPYFLALLEWTLPVVSYYQFPIMRKRYAAFSAGIICSKLIDK